MLFRTVEGAGEAEGVGDEGVFAGGRSEELSDDVVGRVGVGGRRGEERGGEGVGVVGDELADA